MMIQSNGLLRLPLSLFYSTCRIEIAYICQGANEGFRAPGLLAIHSRAQRQKMGLLSSWAQSAFLSVLQVGFAPLPHGKNVQGSKTPVTPLLNFTPNVRETLKRAWVSLDSRQMDKETVVLRWWRLQTDVWFIKRVDN